mmetsp:Transcript_43509/g.76664  ORF Transcript_43509/g.76664 Transcript_43509/m.76664 type:complete len:135 (+) Transcript_43509:92-496(+)
MAQALKTPSPTPSTCAAPHDAHMQLRLTSTRFSYNTHLAVYESTNATLSAYAKRNDAHTVLPLHIRCSHMLLLLHTRAATRNYSSCCTHITHTYVYYFCAHDGAHATQYENSARYLHVPNRTLYSFITCTLNIS